PERRALPGERARRLARRARGRPARAGRARVAVDPRGDGVPERRDHLAPPRPLARARRRRRPDALRGPRARGPVVARRDAPVPQRPAAAPPGGSPRSAPRVMIPPRGRDMHTRTRRWTAGLLALSIAGCQVLS